MNFTPSLRPLVALAASLLLLAGCGGGGGGGDGGGGEAESVILDPATLGASSQYANACTVDNQKKWVRSYLDEIYLWYDEVPQVNAAAHRNAPDYFEALLVKTPDASGRPRDRFSAVLPLSRAEDLRQSLGLAQAADAGAVVKAGSAAVPVVRADDSPGGRRVGYILFSAHDRGAQDELVAGFRQLQTEGVQDLVLDLRDNSGGYLYIALAAASMVTGPAASGEIFEQLRYNDKRTARPADTLRFSSTLQFGEPRNPAGTPLPQLALPRVFVLTTGRTCSASESIINSLRGIDVEVVRIGSTTCGKPYGFEQKNNCGYAYFPVEFQGANAKGFGDYTSGFAPTCGIAETGATPGSATDPLYQGALTYIDTGNCPAGTATGAQMAATPLLGASEIPNRPDWAGRLLLPQPSAP